MVTSAPSALQLKHVAIAPNYMRPRTAERRGPKGLPLGVQSAKVSIQHGAMPAQREKKEMGRVEHAKQNRSTYWHVVSKEDGLKDDNAQRRIRTTRAATTNNANIDLTTHVEDTATSHAAQETIVVTVPAPAYQEPPVTLARQASVDGSAAEDWATPATQQGLQQQQQNLPIDPRLLGMELPARTSLIDNPQNTGPAATTAPHSTTGPPYHTDEEFSAEDADAWLANIDWQHDVPDAAASPPTSVATEPRTSQGRIYKSCSCPQHQDIYDSWPQRDASLDIARCMTICPYCGKKTWAPADLRKHLMRAEYAKRNLSVNVGAIGRNRNMLPGWTAKERPPESSLGPETSTERTSTRATGNAAITNRANPAPLEC